MNGLTPRAGILDIAPYVAGESSIAGREQIIKLSSNEGALGPSPAAVAAYREAADRIHRYPDGGAVALRAAIGARHGLDPDRIVCGAGSDEMLYLLARAYAGPGDQILTHAHAFVMYRLIAHTVGAEIVEAPETALTADVDALLAHAGPKTRIVYIANPNNPTGTFIDAAGLARLRAGLGDDVLLVIDAAYAEYVTRNDYAAGEALVDAAVDAGGNTVMTRTFSKIFALGGVRLGWAYCPPRIADVLNRLRPPFNVSSPAQAAGIAALKDEAFFAMSRDHNSVWRPWITDRVVAAGLKTTPSVGNFILVEFPRTPGRDSEAALQFLAGRGIIPRRTAGNGLPEHLRITVGTEAEMRVLADAIDDFMA